jgi:hypothetical protein
MNKNRIVIDRKCRIAGTFSVHDGTVALILGAFIEKKAAATERFAKEEAIQVCRYFRRWRSPFTWTSILLDPDSVQHIRRWK